jgi:hypothetical protein
MLPDEPCSSASSNLFRKISAKPAQAVQIVRFWRSWQTSIKHAASKKRQGALLFWDFSTSFQEISFELSNDANEVDFEREFFAIVVAKKN